MIELAKKNMSFLVIFIAILVSAKISLDDTVSKTKYESPKVPEFKLPDEISSSSDATPAEFLAVKVSVLTGEQTAIQVKPLLPKKQKKRSKVRRLVVNAIMIEGKERVANINGSMMKVGGYINGRTVLKIKKNGVLVTGPNGKRLIKMQD